MPLAIINVDDVYDDDSDRYFDSEEAAFEAWYDEDLEPPAVIYPCKPMSFSADSRLSALAENVIEWVEQHIEEANGEDDGFSEYVRPQDEAKLKSILGLWITRTCRGICPDMNKPYDPRPAYIEWLKTNLAEKTA